MGLISDLHHGLEKTALPRLETFLTAAKDRKVDCIAQLGDFNYGGSRGRECIDLWNGFSGDSFHVLGNHDMDVLAKDDILSDWEMAGRYYSFDRGGFHFVVLDRNNLKTPDGYVPYARANYFVDSNMRGYADPEQLEWLRNDLEAAQRPIVIFMHQGLGMQNDAYDPGDPRGIIETILEQANRKSDRSKVVACFCGHHHIDCYNCKNGIHYVWMNSASYYWVGDRYGRMAPYRDSLFAFIQFHPDGWIEIEGRNSQWVSPTPAERGYPGAEKLTTNISNRHLAIST